MQARQPSAARSSGWVWRSVMWTNRKESDAAALWVRAAAVAADVTNSRRFISEGDPGGQLQNPRVEGAGRPEEGRIRRKHIGDGTVVVSRLLNGREVGTIQEVEGFSHQAHLPTLAPKRERLRKPRVHGREARALDRVSAVAGRSIRVPVAVVV